MKKYLKCMALISTLMIFYLFCFGCQTKNKEFRIGVLQWTEKIHAFNQTYKGVLDGLKDKGYKKGVNLDIDYKNVEQDKELALKTALDFVKKRVDLILTLGTGSTLAALKATEKKPIPIVFSIVGAPKATGIIRNYDDSGRNITGVSMKVEVKEQFEMLKEILPEMEKLGIIYCTEMPQAVVTGKEAAAAAPGLGWKPLTVSFPKRDLPELDKIVNLVAKKVDAIYIPTDPILDSPENLETIIHISDEHKIPVVSVSGKSVEDGVLMAVHCDFYEIGRQAADPMVQIISGVNVRTIRSQRPIIKKLSLNLKKARNLNIKIKRQVILKTDNIID
ncbi:MAG: putative ABC transport system substrate-binding protein [Desulfobacteraceae bacterium Eth-SRB2]|nr:MAG: putative ABC transport system substrate-binding protein [Desulfobacteraceae bacterium Eth-SRB2]